MRSAKLPRERIPMLGAAVLLAVVAFLCAVALWLPAPSWDRGRALVSARRLYPGFTLTDTSHGICNDRPTLILHGTDRNDDDVTVEFFNDGEVAWHEVLRMSAHPR